MERDLTAAKNGLDRYKRSAVDGASPIRLIVMLYDGALKNLEQGKAAMADRDIFTQNEKIKRAQECVSELISSLNMEAGGEVAQNLLSLYTFIYNTLFEANVNDDPEMLDQCAELLSDLRSSWAELDAQGVSAPEEALPDAA